MRTTKEQPTKFEKLLRLDEPVCWAFWGVRTIDFLDVSFMIPVDLILTGDFGKELNSIQKQRKVFSLEAQNTPIIRRDWTIESFDKYFSSAAYQDLVGYLRQELGYCRRICFVCYGTPHLLEKLRVQLGKKIEILSSTSQLRELISNKLIQYRSFEKLGLPIPATRYICFKNETYPHLSSELGEKFVVHLTYSNSGSGTFLCDCPKDFEKLQRLFPNVEPYGLVTISQAFRIS